MSGYDSLSNYQHGYQVEGSNYNEVEEKFGKYSGYANHNYHIAESHWNYEGPAERVGNYGYQIQSEEAVQAVGDPLAVSVGPERNQPIRNEEKNKPLPTNLAARPRHWTEELASLQSIVNMSERRRKLMEWHDSLVSTAVRHAGLIVAALHDPVKLASMTAGMGGIAGGTKFIFDGLVFKLATDPSIRGTHLYGGGKTPNLERAAKAASQELKGANALFECLYEQKLDVTVPMQVMLDYCGVRLVAMPLLPIRGSETMIYGSCDGGHTVLADPLIHQYLSGICSHLHLAEHLVISDIGSVKLWVAGDVEGHRGHDGRLYLLDLARTFPPEDPRLVTHLPPCSSAIWFRLIRPEFLRLIKIQNMAALSSDSFSKWGSADMSHNQNARKATEYLLQTQIPKLAWHLASFLNSVSLGAGSSLVESFPDPFPTAYAQTLVRSPITGESLFSSLSAYLRVNKDVPDWAAGTVFYPANYIYRADLSKEFHDWGVPMRHLGLVHETVFSPELKQVLVREGVARSLKNMIRAELRMCGALGVARSAVQVLVDWFNLIVRGPFIMKNSISATPEEKADATDLWVRRLPEDVSSRFGALLVRGITLSTVIEHQMFQIVSYLIQAIGVKLSVLGNIKLVRMCSAGHQLTFGANGNTPEAVCGNCGVTTASSNTYSCAVCSFYRCVDCFGTPHKPIQFTVQDIEEFAPRLKTMSYINVIQVQCLADRAVELAWNASRSEIDRRGEFLDLMQQIKSICEKLLSTDPTCKPIQEQLRFSTHAVELLSAASLVERRSFSDKFLRTFASEIAKTNGVVSDGLKMVTVAGAMGDRMLVAKATKFQNLELIRCIVEAGGRVGGAVGLAIKNGNRAATAYLLEAMNQQFNSEAKVVDGHFMRKASTCLKKLHCREKHSFHWMCRSCDFCSCNVITNMVQKTRYVSTSSRPRFHYAIDLTTHNHPLIHKDLSCSSMKPPLCEACKKQIRDEGWFCLECDLMWCLLCVEPENDSYTCSFISPLDTSTIDDSMLRTIAFGLQKNAAISSVELVACPFSVRATREFFSQGSFSPSLTSLDFSGNMFDSQAMQCFATGISTMNLRQLSLAYLPSPLSLLLRPLCQGLLDTHIEDLNLCGNSGIGDALIAEFKQAATATSSLPRTLKKLNLDWTNTTAAGMSILLSLKWKLTDLLVSWNQLGDEGLLMLIQQPGSIRNVYAHTNEVTSFGHEQLSGALLSTTLNNICLNFNINVCLQAIRLSTGSKRAFNFCDLDHELTKGANVAVYKPKVAFCNNCGARAAVQDLLSCVPCEYDICVDCSHFSLLPNYFDMGFIFDARRFGSSELELMYAVKQCQNSSVGYILFTQGVILPLPSALKLVALDLSQQLVPLRTYAYVIAPIVSSDSLERIVLKFIDSSPLYDVVLQKLINHPSLTDLVLHEVPISETFLKLLQHGTRLKRLKLKWKKMTTSAPLLQGLAHLTGTLSTLELSGMCLNHFDGELAPYTPGKVEHLFHCFTKVDILRLMRCNLQSKYAAQLFQAVSCNLSIHTFHLTLTDARALSGVKECGAEIAKALATIFSSCPKLSILLFHKLLCDTGNNPLHDAIHQLVWPALQKNTSLTFLKLKPACPICWKQYIEAIQKRPTMIQVDWSDEFVSSPPPSCVEVSSKISGLNVWRASFKSQGLKDLFTGLLASASQPREPLRLLALSHAIEGGKNLEGCVSLCGQVLSSPILQVRELCIHDVPLNAEWVAALKGSSLQRLDLSGDRINFDISIVVDIVVSLRTLMSINLRNRLMDNLADGLVTMIDGNPGLQEVIVNAHSLNPSAYPIVLAAALGPKTNLVYLELLHDVNSETEFVIQEMLWASAKPLLFFPFPKLNPRAKLLHLARMDRLGTPQIPKWCWTKCHGGQ